MATTTRRLPNVRLGPMAGGAPGPDEDWSEIEALLSAFDPAASRRGLRKSRSWLGSSGVLALVLVAAVGVGVWSRLPDAVTPRTINALASASAAAASAHDRFDEADRSDEARMAEGRSAAAPGAAAARQAAPMNPARMSSADVAPRPSEASFDRVAESSAPDDAAAPEPPTAVAHRHRHHHHAR